MKILGYDYTVVEGGDPDHIGAFGRNHPRTLTTQVAEGLASQQRESAVLHEIIEALNYALGLKLEHQAIMSLEAGLYQVLTGHGVNLAPLTREIDGEWPWDPNRTRQSAGIALL